MKGHCAGGRGLVPLHTLHVFLGSACSEVLPAPAHAAGEAVRRRALFTPLHISPSPSLPCLAGSLDVQGASPAAQACDLGMHMLLELFRGQKEFRRDVVAICHNRLIGAKVGGSLALVCVSMCRVIKHSCKLAK